jgi:radical SAM family uncharacterized protein/radical SAM-linked protein
LDLSGITRRAEDRSPHEPIVLGGGPCTANPEPVADFFDAILIGDAEGALDSLLDVVRDGRANGADRVDVLRRMAGVAGVYVPRFYRWCDAEGENPARWETADAAAPLPVKRVWVERLDPSDQPELPIVPFADVIQDRLGMEIMRGCTQGCRFCQAGYWYRPVREHDPEMVLDRIERQVRETGFEEIGLLSLSTADYSQVEPLVYHLADRLQAKRVSVSLPSLRADAFSVGLAEGVSRVRKSGFTFAPETGSNRLRRVINKTFTNADMVNAAEAAFSKGWQLIKIYAMIGLPTETDDDLEELARLAEEIVRAGRRNSNRRVEIKVSVGCFVPKAWTPFQWQPFVPVEEQHRRIRLLKDRFRRIRGARLSWSEAKEAAIEALLSRGGRHLSTTIERAHDLGAVFDGWSDHHDTEAWHRAIDETGVDLGRELGPRDFKEILPWDLIDAGVSKSYLRAEWRRALREIETEDCKWGHCYRCGVPGDGEDTQLADPSLPLLGEPVPEEQRAKAAAYSSRPEPTVPPRAPEPTQQPVYRRYRFGFSKTGDARYLSHRQLMDSIERSLRAAGVPTRYTEGYNPHIRVSMGPALAVGHEGLAEVFDVDCTAPVRQHHIEALNRLLPEGVEILNARDLIPGAPSLGKMVSSARYRIAREPSIAWPETTDDVPDAIRAGLSTWELQPDGGLRVDLNQRQQDGPLVSVKELLAALGVAAERIPFMPITRERLILAPQPHTKSRGKEDQEANGAERPS